MNHVLLLAKNNLSLTQRCIESVRGQDVPTKIHVYDNESSDGTQDWLSTQEDIIDQSSSVDLGVSGGWNFVLEILFQNWEAEHCLVIGNDTILAPWTYSALLSLNVPFVTGVDIGMSPLPEAPEILPLSPNPDFSCFLIRRECWEKVGPFDERLVHYCGDCDYHIRAHRAGMPLYKACVPYNHERSSTLNRATPEERAAIQLQANMDRQTFRSIYGCLPGSAEYCRIFA